MLVNRRPQRNGGVSDSSKSTADKAAEEMRRLNLEGSDDNGGVGHEPGSYPDRPGEPDCMYFLRTGTCGYGSNCRFNHPSNGHADGVRDTGELPERIGQPDCGHYLKTGTCKYGSRCKYNHPKDSSVFPNMLGLPMRQDAKTCTFYMRTGFCKYGYACKFHHPQPSSTTNALPAIEPVVYGSVSHALMPTSDAPSGGEHPTASLLNNAFFSSPIRQLPPQTYMPVILPLSQGWNTYMGSFSPYPSGQLPVSYLPERPDQPDCRYFMSYGICKYGVDCKYHQPREKISELASSSFGPLGLPLRPGHPVCAHYTHYGICKYGPSCKFDHPQDGYSYAYTLGVPPLAIPFSSPPAHQRTSPLVVSSETSPSEALSELRDWSKDGESAGSKAASCAKTLGDSPESSVSLANSHAA